VLKVMRSSEMIFLDVLAIAGIVAGLILVFANWQTLPDKIPAHFDFSGKVTSYSSKNTLWILSGSSIFSFFMFRILVRYPHIFNYLVAITRENAAIQYRLAITMMYWLLTEMVWIFTLIQGQIILAAKAPNPTLHPLLVLFPVVVIVGTVGNYLWKSFQSR